MDSCKLGTCDALKQAEARVRELEFYRADALKEMRQQLELLSAYHAEGVTARIGSVLARVRELEKDLGAAVEQKVHAIFNLGRCKALLNTANLKLERLRNV